MKLRATEIKKPNLPLPEKYALSGTEDAAQIALFMWAATVRDKYPELKWMFAIPNGGSRHKAEAGKLRAMGVRAGVPDLCLPVRRGRFGGLYIEMKRPKTNGKRAGFVKPEQSLWLEFLKSQGYGAISCRGWEHARDTIIEYLEWKE